ncbi:MAG: nodulation protein NfeD [Vampirovibrionales bacterium]|nr:nodulation protein NfeD [Vampirovibrionales bacterium]
MNKLPGFQHDLSRCCRLLFWLALALSGLNMLAGLWESALANPSISIRSKTETIQTAQPNKVLRLRLDDEMISGISADYIRNGIEQAARNGASAVVIELDTPGGLLSATHTIVKSILASPVPVITYVAPEGGRAGSAGVFITMASHIAAMHPGTRIGAAHPVDMNGRWPPKGPALAPLDEASQRVMAEKIINDQTAAIRALAASHGRNQQWATLAITDSASLTADEALKRNVVDMVAPSLQTLLMQIDGRTVRINGQLTPLRLGQPIIETMTFSTHDRILSFLADPMVFFVLLTLGLFGIFFEATHPGVGVAGVLGGLCLLLALVGIHALSINVVGVGLMVVGILLFIIEIFTPTMGILFALGVLCLMVGAVLLYQTGEPYLLAVLPYVLTLTLALCALAGFILFRVVKTHRRAPKGAVDKLIHQIGRLMDDVEPGQSGKMKVYGEIWDVQLDPQTAQGLRLNDRARVIGVDRERGLLSVAPLEEDS